MVRLHGVGRARERPQMYGSYLGEIGPESARRVLAQMFNSLVDDFFAGQATRITLAVWDDGRIMLRHDGPGFPTDVFDPKSGQPLVEWLATNSACSYERERPPPRHKWRPLVPYFLVNVYSTSLIFENRIDGQAWQTEFARGQLVAPARPTGPADEEGITLAFQFDPEIFGSIEIDTDWLLEFAREQSCLYPGLSVELIDERADLHQEFRSEQGLADLVRDRIAARPDDQRQTLYEQPIRFELTDHDYMDQELRVGVAFQHTVPAYRQFDTYVNGTRVKETIWAVEALGAAFREFAHGNRRRQFTSRRPPTGRIDPTTTQHITAVISTTVCVPSFNDPVRGSMPQHQIDSLLHRGTHDALLRHPEAANAIVQQLNTASIS